MEAWKKNLIVCWISMFIMTSGTSQVAPVLPLYVEYLGIHGAAEISQWAGLAFGINFISMAIFSPIWGKAADQYGCKAMVLRASLWMAVIMVCMSFAQDVYQLIILRALQGAMAGFISAMVPLVASQTPQEKIGWALGVMSTGQVGGTLIEPLFGGLLAETLGFRSVFLSIGVLSFFAFFASLFFIKEKFVPPAAKNGSIYEIWDMLPDKKLMIAMFITTLMLQLSLMSIQPIISVYVMTLSHDEAPVALISGAIFAASGFASVIAAPILGRLSDRIGSPKVILGALIFAGILFIPQAFVSSALELGILRFLLGLATAGLLPSINALVKQSVPNQIVGRAFGFNQSAQHFGAFGGAVLGGQAAAAFGLTSVFFFTGTLLLMNAVWVYQTIYQRQR